MAFRSFWPSGRRLEAFLHAIRLFKLNSQKTDRPNHESAGNPIPASSKHTQKFPCIQWLQQQPKKQKFRTTISQNLVFREKFSANQRFCAASPRLKPGGGLHPQVPLRFTWGYSWCHLYEVGVAPRSFWPSGRRLEVFLHAIRLFRLNSQKSDKPNRESACNPIPTNNNHTQKFP